MTGSEIHQAFILADTACIEILLPAKTGKVLHVVHLILAAYYSWDLLYPKQYPLLGFFQSEVIKDKKNTFHKSSAYIKFEKEFET